MKEITIVLQDTKGALARISGLLGQAGINIEAIDAEEIDHHGIMHLNISEEALDKAYEILRDHGFQTIPQEVLLVRVEDRPGELAKLAGQLAEADINVRSMRIVKREEGASYCALVPDDLERARRLLDQHTLVCAL